MKTEELQTVSGWFAGRVPEGWFAGAPAVTSDGKQIKVVGALSEPELDASAPAPTKAGAQEGRIGRFREETRGYRIHIAREAEHRFKLPITWGATCGKTSLDFTPGGSGRGEGAGEGKGKGRKPRDVQNF